MTAARGAGEAADIGSRRTVAEGDPSSFHALLARLPEQSRAAWALAHSWAMPAGFRRPSRVVLLGMGGSAIGADIAATLARVHGRVPVEIVRHYAAPPVDGDALVVACSFSGNTEETIAAFEGALATPGMRVALTTGGRLAAIARERRVPLLTYEWDGPPRTALGFGLFTVLGLLVRLGAIELAGGEVDCAFDALADADRRYRLDQPTNEAEQLAAAIHGGIPVIIGADFLDVVARRFASEISENAKQWAFSASLPEFNHNTMQALSHPNGAPRALVPVILDAPAVHPRNRRRVVETVRMMAECGVRVRVADAGGAAPLAAIARATSLASWTSYYLALLDGVDPMPVETLDRFKMRMSQDEPA